jgi:NAD(P)-dependent dehydrogenase (short-subunit alcohol dehydrogenase family)
LTTDPRTYTYGDGLLRDRIILITGASDGIGRTLAIEVARLGAQVVLHGRNTAKLEKVYDEIYAVDGAKRPSIAVLDLESANADNYTTLASSIEDEFGRLDGLVHNASILGELY